MKHGKIRVCVEVFSLLGCLPATAAKEKKKDRKRNLSPAIIIFCVFCCCWCVLCCVSSRSRSVFFFIFHSISCFVILISDDAAEDSLDVLVRGIVFALQPYCCFFSLLLSALNSAVDAVVLVAHVPIISSFVGSFLFFAILLHIYGRTS